MAGLAHTVKAVIQMRDRRHMLDIRKTHNALSIINLALHEVENVNSRHILYIFHSEDCMDGSISF